MTTPTPAHVSTGDRLLTVAEVAAYLRVPVATLYQWRYLHTGPAAYRIGRHIRYHPATVHAWLNQQTSAPGDHPVSASPMDSQSCGRRDACQG